MKNSKYIIVCTLILILLSGCSYESKITMDYDGSLKEEVIILDDNESLSSDKNDEETIIKNTISNYESVLNFRNYSNEVILGKKKSGAKIYKSYKNICSYFQDTAFNQYVYKHIKCTEDEYYYIIENDTPHIPYCPDCSEGPYLDDAKISITLPISATESNADKVKDNTYTWIYSENTDEEKAFYLKIDKRLLEENKLKVEEYNKDKNEMKVIITILVIIVVIILILILGMKLFKKYKANRIEY